MTRSLLSAQRAAEFLMLTTASLLNLAIHNSPIQIYARHSCEVEKKKSTFRQRQTYSWYGENEAGVA